MGMALQLMLLLLHVAAAAVACMYVSMHAHKQAGVVMQAGMQAIAAMVVLPPLVVCPPLVLCRCCCGHSCGRLAVGQSLGECVALRQTGTRAGIGLLVPLPLRLSVGSVGPVSALFFCC